MLSVEQGKDTWHLNVVVGRSYGSFPESEVAKFPDDHIPLPMPDGHAQPPTPAAFGQPLDCRNYRSLAPTWLLAVECRLGMGISGADPTPTEPRVNFSSMKYRSFSPRIIIDPGEVRRLKDYLFERATGQPPTREPQPLLPSMRPYSRSVCC